MKKISRFMMVVALCATMVLSALPVASAGTYDGLTKLKVKEAVATYSQTSEGGFPASNAVDGDLSTRWSSYGSDTWVPHALQMELTETSIVSAVDLWLLGDGRTYTYDIYVTDGPTVSDGTFSTTAQAVVTGATGNGSGSSAQNPSYNTVNTVVLPASATGKYVTVVLTEVLQESAQASGAIWEVRLWGNAVTGVRTNLALDGTATATFEQTEDGGCPATNANDNDLSTRWSTFGASSTTDKALQIDLACTGGIDLVELWWFNSDSQVRSYTYDLYITDTPLVEDGTLTVSGQPTLAEQTANGSGNGTGPDEAGMIAHSFTTPVEGRYVTIVVTEVTGNSAAVLWEAKVWGEVVSASQKTIASFREEADITVDKEIAKEDLPLPGVVVAQFTDGSSRQLPVTWQCEDYNPQKTGTYTFTGNVATGETLLNPDGITVTKNVIVKPGSMTKRTELSINDGWVFMKGSLADAKEPGYNDAAFEAVTLPHSWNAGDGADGGNDYYRGEAWYRRHLNYRSGFDGKRVYLYFEGVSRECTVYVNGFEAGGHRGAYTAFYVDITDFLVEGDNLLAVRATNEITQDLAPLSGDFTQYGGIYRDVTLVVTGETHIETDNYGSDGLFMTVTDVSKASGTVTAKATVRNDSDTAQTVSLVYDLSVPADGTVDWIEDIPENWLPFDPADMTVAGGQEVYTVTKDVTIAAGETYDFSTTFTVDNPHLWNGLADPFRYIGTMSVKLDGVVIDTVSEYIGFRAFAVDADTGAYLNGKSYNLRGVSRHQDREDMANALTVKEHNQDFAMIYEMGCNAIRLAHYPQADYFYNLCDQYGLLVWAEIPFVNDVGGEGTYAMPDATREAFFETTRVQMKELIRQQYNHTSIVTWGIQNEVYPHLYADVMVAFSKDLYNLCKSEDPTRLVTEATANGGSNDNTTDLTATNLYPGFYYDTYSDFTRYVESFRAGSDGRPVGVSEYGSGANYEHHCECAPAEVCESGDIWEYEEYQTECHESYLAQINELDYLWCAFIWNMFDFGADARHEAQVSGINNKGLVSFDRTVKKDSFYLYKANWSPLPTVHIGSSRYDLREQNTTNIKGYSNCDSVSLYVNDVLVSTIKKSDCAQETVFVWKDVALQGGSNTIRMVGTLDGKEYVDEVVWDCVILSAKLMTIREDIDAISLPAGDVPVANMPALIGANTDITVTVYEADGKTVVTDGLVTEGMMVKVVAGDVEKQYTFIRNNLALNGSATATYEQTEGGNYPASKAIDGDINTRWSTYSGGSHTLPQSLYIDLGQSQDLATMELLWFGDGRTYTYNVYVTDTPMPGAGAKAVLSNLTGTGVGSSQDNLTDQSAVYNKVELPEGTNGRYVTIEVTGGANNSNIAALWEVGLYQKEMDMSEYTRVDELIAAIGAITADNYREKETALLTAEQAVVEIKEQQGEDMVYYLANLVDLQAARTAYNTYSSAPVPTPFGYGDVNGDQKVNAQDALLVLKFAVGKQELTEQQQQAARVSDDQSINAVDALLILKYAVGNISQFPVETA